MRLTRRALLPLLLTPAAARAYPLDGFLETGIRRLLGYRLAVYGEIESSIRLVPGARRTLDQIELRLRGVNETFDVTPSTPKDPELQAGLERVFAGRDPSYSLCLLDVTDPKQPRYAALRPEVKRIPGSLGKLLVATGMLDALRRRFPADTQARREFLKETVVAADSFVHRDGKTAPYFNPGDERIVNRVIQTGDRFSLYEWLDHMLSRSSNAAASMVWKEAVLLREFGERYPLSPEAEQAFLRETPRLERQDKALRTIEDALRAADIDTDELRIGTFFTRNASAVFPGTASYSTPLELMRFLVRIEQGRLVDPWSSLELKRLIYFSRPRYRYASSPALNDAAVFFKSGSLFQCEPEEGFTCRAYAGNKLNLMHSVAIVERPELRYLVTMTSNVLRINGAVEHQTVAGEIDRLLRS